jgi:biotin synthase
LVIIFSSYHWERQSRDEREDTLSTSRYIAVDNYQPIGYNQCMRNSYAMTLERALDAALEGHPVAADEAQSLSSPLGSENYALFAAASRVRERFRGDKVDICSIVNAKSGACGEDCRFCAQSARYRTGAPVYPLLEPDSMERAAAEARRNGARRFCIVTSGRGIDDEADLGNIAEGVRRVKALDLSPCATLGTLTRDQLLVLKDAGLHRYHHNIETSREHFPSICSTHTFDDRVELLRHARAIGLSTCSGGILGMGERMVDRISMAISLRDLDVDSVPLNFLMPIPGTPMEQAIPIDPMESLVSIALFRLILPGKEIRICGGRAAGLGTLHPFIFMAGADGFMIGNYLTRTGLDPQTDLRMIRELGLAPAAP